MDSMNVNANTYTLASSATSASITLVPADINTTSLRLVNAATTAVFVTTAKGAKSAVLPASATAPTQGTIIPAGSSRTVYKNPLHDTISAISVTAGTGNLWVSVGAGT